MINQDERSDLVWIAKIVLTWWSWVPLVHTRPSSFRTARRKKLECPGLDLPTCLISLRSCRWHCFLLMTVMFLTCRSRAGNSSWSKFFCNQPDEFFYVKYEVKLTPTWPQLLSTAKEVKFLYLWWSLLGKPIVRVSLLNSMLSFNLIKAMSLSGPNFWNKSLWNKVCLSKLLAVMRIRYPIFMQYQCFVLVNGSTATQEVSGAEGDVKVPRMR